MKTFIYGMKDSDGICGNLVQSGHKHFIAEQIQAFYKKVGQYVPCEWFIYGEFETKTGAFNIYPEAEKFDWEKQLADDMVKDAKNDGVETSSSLISECEE